MKLDDEQIERYSRQLILAEVGPHGQARFNAARVAVAGIDGAAERVVAYLAAAGVGWIAADPRLHGAVDPSQPDLTIAALVAAPDSALVAAPDPTLTAARGTTLDVLVASAASFDEAAALLDAYGPARTTFWIVDGHAGQVPPCPRCAHAALTSRVVPAELSELRAALLGTIVATEVLKTVLGAGAALAGRVLAYDPTAATVDAVEVEVRPDCSACAPH